MQYEKVGNRNEKDSKMIELCGRQIIGMCELIAQTSIYSLNNIRLIPGKLKLQYFIFSFVFNPVLLTFDSLD